MISDNNPLNWSIHHGLHHKFFSYVRFFKSSVCTAKLSLFIKNYMHPFPSQGGGKCFTIYMHHFTSTPKGTTRWGGKCFTIYQYPETEVNAIWWVPQVLQRQYPITFNCDWWSIHILPVPPFQILSLLKIYPHCRQKFSKNTGYCSKFKILGEDYV